jgi:hypothetical protein
MGPSRAVMGNLDLLAIEQVACKKTENEKKWPLGSGAHQALTPFALQKSLRNVLFYISSHPHSEIVSK